MKKPIRLLLLALLPLVGTLRAGEVATGKHQASSTARVTISFPSLHGVDVPSEVGPASAVRLAVSHRGNADAVPLSLIGTDPTGTWHVIKALSPPGGRSTLLSSTRSQRDERPVEIFSRQGASGWLNMEDRVGTLAVLPASRSDERPRLTLIYEVWHF